MENKINEVAEKLRQKYPETMQCECNVCRKAFHVENAKYCTRCGTELDLDTVISKTVRHLH